MDPITTEVKAVQEQPNAAKDASMPPPCLGLEENIRPLNSHRRTASWQSDETLILISDESSSLLAHGKGDDGAWSDDNFSGDDSYPYRPRREPWIKSLITCSVTVIAILLSLDILLHITKVRLLEEEDHEDPALYMWDRNGTDTDGKLWYPTNFLQDVVPKPIHSHNDYWRKVPLFTALGHGCTGVEADVWLFDEPERSDTLYIGHQEAALQPNRTFQSLYIQPLVDVLERQNPKTEFYAGNYRGVFDTDPDQTLILLVDVKTSGPSTWAKVVEQLEPLRQRDWLTYFANGTVHTRPVTVVGTGNTPFADLVANETYRDYFFDAPLSKLAYARSYSGGAHHYDMTNSYYASVSFRASIGSPWLGVLSAEQMERIREQVRAAHERGLRVRYWDLPAWPLSARNRIWDLLVEEGVDMLNADDLKGAANREWRY